MSRELFAAHCPKLALLSYTYKYSFRRDILPYVPEIYAGGSEKVKILMPRLRTISLGIASLGPLGIASLGLLATMIMGLPQLAQGGSCCPFCSAVSQTLRQEMEQTDLVAFAKIIPGTETESDAEFELNTLISGESLAEKGQKFRVNYFGKAKPDQSFLLMGVDPPDLLWSSPLPVSQTVIDYIQAVSQLPPKDSAARLKYYLNYLEHAEAIIARDAYDEFASAPYPEIIALKEQMNRPQLLKWIKNTDLPADRKRLYLVMLGICGQPEDAKLLEEMLRSEDPNRRAGLDAMIACYATLRGAEGLEVIDELFLANKQSQYADTYAAIMALRFHGTEGGVIDKERVLVSMRLLLDRPELADLVIPDLARWEDWSQVEKVVGLFKNADEKTSWVRVPVINYLRACPLPEAASRLAELKEIDPAAFKRATSFFPVPKASSSSSTDSTSVPPQPLDEAVRALAANDSPARLSAGQALASGATGVRLPLVSTRPLAAVESNRTFTLSVMGMVSITLWLTMWLAISGAGNHGLLAKLMCLRD